MSLPFLFLTLALLSGVYYGIRYAGAPTERKYSTLVKPLALIFITLAAIVSGANVLVIFAFALSALGDYFLATKGERGFRAGLAAFSLAHICFSVFFYTKAGDYSLLAAVLFTLYYIALMAAIWSFVGKMRTSVLVYGFLLTMMAILAFGSTYGIWLKLGVVLFVLSDSLIALEKFSPYFDGLNGKGYRHTIWWSYLCAQILIAYRVLIAGG